MNKIFSFGIVFLVLLVAGGLWYVVTSETKTQIDVGVNREMTPSVPFGSVPDTAVIETIPPAEAETGAALTPNNSFFNWFRSGVTPTPKSATPKISSVRGNGEEEAVASYFESQIAPYSRTITAGKTYVVGDFAFQRWGDENTAGIALLQRSLSGWELIDYGGGAPNLEWLLSLQVPTSTAEALLDASGF